MKELERRQENQKRTRDLVFGENRFQVARERCDECLLSPNALVDELGRKDILDRCGERGAEHHFVCHKFSQKDPKSNVCCRAFYDRDPDHSQLMQLAHRLDAVEFVDVPDTPDKFRFSDAVGFIPLGETEETQETEEEEVL